MKSFFTLVLVFLLSSTTFATIHFTAEPTGVSQDSGFVNVTSTPTTSTGTTGSTPTPTPVTTATTGYIIYGGAAGSTAGCPDSTSLCNTCIIAPSTAGGGDNNLNACNEKQVQGQTQIVFSIYSDVSTAVGVGSISNNTSGDQIVGAVPSSTVGLPSGNVVTITVTWAQLMTGLGETVTFDGSGAPVNTNATIRVGLACSGNLGGGTTTPTTGTTGTSCTDDYATVTVIFQQDFGNVGTGNFQSLNQGCTTSTDNPVCYFAVSSGDHSARLEKIKANSGFPDFESSTFVAARLYYEKTAFADISPKSSYKRVLTTLDPTGTGNITTDTTLIDGLDNDSLYYFKMAAEDSAGNVGFWTATSSGQDTACEDGDYFGIISQSDPTNKTITCHIVKPGEIQAILSKELNCFIATAAYGSPMAKEVQTFRTFRNLFLLKHSWGVEFVRLYYKVSPPIAHFIARHEVLRQITRTALWPALGFASLSLKYGTVYVSIALAFALIFFVLAIRFGTRSLRLRQGKNQ